MKIKLGIIAPFVLEIGILLLYSSIRYQVIDRSILIIILIFMYPILIAYVLSPFMITFFTQMDKEIEQLLNNEFDILLGSYSDDFSDFEDNRTIIQQNRTILQIKDNIDIDIGKRIRSKLIPILKNHALENYKDTFFSRDIRTNKEYSLEYFEGLTLFSLLTLFFIMFDLTLLILMGFGTYDLYFIVLDHISDPIILLSVSLLFALIGLLSFGLFLYARKRMIAYLPYSIPILFNENTRDQYIRRETLRSILQYNYDNITDRDHQKRFGSIFVRNVDSIVTPLLRDEVIIHARTELARKLAWKEYSEIVLSEEIKQEKTPLQNLLIGKKIAKLQIKEKFLLGLNSDYEFVLHELHKWTTINDEHKLVAYFKLYRIIEHIFKQIITVYNILDDDGDYNFYNYISEMKHRNLLNENERLQLHNFRHRRNMLMHEPGTELGVSKETILSILEIMNNLLNRLDKL